MFFATSIVFLPPKKYSKQQSGFEVNSNPLLLYARLTIASAFSQLKMMLRRIYLATTIFFTSLKGPLVSS